MANMFCGYACIVHAMRGELATAALFIGFAFVLDMLDGRIARMTGTTSAFGVEFDSLADVISFGVAPAILSFKWGLEPLGQIGWAAGFLFVSAAAVRLARFNIQSGTQDKRYFVGLPSPAAAVVPAATVFAYPAGFQGYFEAWPVLSMMIVPALLMVSTIRYRSFKSLDLQSRRSYPVLFLLALGLAVLAASPRFLLAGHGVHVSGVGVRRSRLASASHASHRRRTRARAVRIYARRAGSAISTVVPRSRSLCTADRAAAQLHIALGDRQSQSGSAGLRREVGLERARQRLFVHPHTSIRHSNVHAIVLGSRGDDERSRTGHRVKRVLDDVGERAGDQRAIDVDRGQASRESPPRGECVRRAQRGTGRRSREGARRRRPRRAWPSAMTRSSRTPTQSVEAVSPASGSSPRSPASTGLSGSPRSAWTRRRCSALS